MFRNFCYVCLIIMAMIIVNSIIGDLYFRSVYSFPQVTETTEFLPDATQRPIQNNLSHADFIEHQGERYTHILRPVAEYSISGYVVALNSNLWLRDVMRNHFDDMALLDIGLSWGELSKPEVLKKYGYTFHSKKTLGQARMLRIKCKYQNNLVYNVSHTHLIPANANVMGALLKIKKHTVVKLEGYLVDKYSNDRRRILTYTSMSRTDTNPTSRGNGACEVLYVTSVQIGNDIYR